MTRPRRSLYRTPLRLASPQSRARTVNRRFRQAHPVLSAMYEVDVWPCAPSRRRAIRHLQAVHRTIHMLSIAGLALLGGAGIHRISR